MLGGNSGGRIDSACSTVAGSVDLGWASDRKSQGRPRDRRSLRSRRTCTAAWVRNPSRLIPHRRTGRGRSSIRRSELHRRHYRTNENPSQAASTAAGTIHPACRRTQPLRERSSTGSLVRLESRARVTARVMVRAFDSPDCRREASTTANLRSERSTITLEGVFVCRAIRGAGRASVSSSRARNRHRGIQLRPELMNRSEAVFQPMTRKGELVGEPVVVHPRSSEKSDRRQTVDCVTNRRHPRACSELATNQPCGNRGPRPSALQ